MKHRRWIISMMIVMTLLLGVAAAIAAEQALPEPSQAKPIQTIPPAGAWPVPQADIVYARIITINTTVDTPSDSQVTTCYYDSSMYNPATDGQCNLRRALVEASHRPAIDRPIQIKFNLPLTDTHYDDSTNTWTVMMEGDYGIVPDSIVTQPDGLIVLDGDTQPGGRDGAPKVIIHSEYSLVVLSQYNTIRNLAFNGGGGVFLNESSNVGGHNLVENVWTGLEADGQSIAYTGDPIMMAGGGISIKSDYNVISNCIVSGGSGIDFQGSYNLIQNNTLGTRSDRTVPQDKLTCFASNAPTNQWYGGWGIDGGTGHGNQVISNTIAGLHSIHSPTETAPPAIWTSGADNLYAYNTIGIDGSGAEVGTCGQGIFVTGQNIQVLTNTIVNARTSFFVADTDDPTEGAIFINDGSPMARQFTIRNNLTRNSTAKVIEFGPAIPSDLRLFEPPRIVSITGTQVVGESEAGSNCPNCLVELYLDDLDNEQDALQLLAVAVMDQAATARFTATLSAPLAANHGIRVAATSQNDNVIPNFLAGTTTRLSPAYGPDATFVRDLAPGWNLFSVDVTPASLAISDVLSSLAGKYDVVLSFEGGGSGGGRTYDPANPGASDLSEMDVLHGYWIHMTTNATQSLQLNYEPARNDTGITLYPGWNLVSYLPDVSLPVTRALTSIDGDYEVVMGFDGVAQTYMPASPQFSDLTRLEPGFAYWIKIKDTAGVITLTYPSALTPMSILATESPLQAQGGASASDFFTPTTEWFDFFGVATLSGYYAAPRNAQIVAYDPDGVVAGAFSVHTSPYYGFLHVYADDPRTAGDEGAEIGDEIRFTINGRLATASKATTWSARGDVKEVNLDAVVPFTTTPTWSDFWGTLTLGGKPAPVGTILAAYDPGGVYIGDFILDEAGKYGFLHAYGDDSTTAVDEGAQAGDNLTFKAFLPLTSTPIALTVTHGSPVWQGRGGRTELNLSGSGGGPVAPSVVHISGPTTGQPNTPYTFTVSVDPLDVTTPLSYVVEYTDAPAPLTASLGRSIVIKDRTWSTTGSKLITVTVSNTAGSAVGTHTIVITDTSTPVAPSAVHISGPTTGQPNTPYTYTIMVDPIDVALPITCTLMRTGMPAPLIGAMSSRAVNWSNVAWSTPGVKHITVTAANTLGSVAGTYTVTITQDISGSKIYLPLVLKSRP